MDILIAIGIAVFMLMFYCFVKKRALQDRLMEKCKKEMANEKIQHKAAQREE